MWFGSRNRPYANAESAFFKSIKRSVLRRQCSLDTNRNLKRLVYNEFYTVAQKGKTQQEICQNTTRNLSETQQEIR